MSVAKFHFISVKKLPLGLTAIPSCVYRVILEKAIQCNIKQSFITTSYMYRLSWETLLTNSWFFITTKVAPIDACMFHKEKFAIY